MSFIEKIALINEVCDKIKARNDEDSVKYSKSDTVRLAIKMETLNVELVRMDMIADLVSDVAKSEGIAADFEDRMVGEEEP